MELFVIVLPTVLSAFWVTVYIIMLAVMVGKYGTKVMISYHGVFITLIAISILVSVYLSYGGFSVEEIRSQLGR